MYYSPKSHMASRNKIVKSSEFTLMWRSPA